MGGGGKGRTCKQQWSSKGLTLHEPWHTNTSTHRGLPLPVTTRKESGAPRGQMGREDLWEWGRTVESMIPVIAGYEEIGSNKTHSLFRETFVCIRSVNVAVRRSPSLKIDPAHLA